MIGDRTFKIKKVLVAIFAVGFFLSFSGRSLGEVLTESEQDKGKDVAMSSSSNLDASEDKILQRAEQIAEIIVKVDSEYRKGKFANARKYAEQVLVIDEDNVDIKDILGRITQEEDKKQAELNEQEESRRLKKEVRLKKKAESEAKKKVEWEAREKARKQSEAKKEKDKIKKKEQSEARRKAREEKSRKKVEEKTQKYVSRARKELAEDNVDGAKRFAYKAQMESSESVEVVNLVEDVNEADSFLAMEKEEIANEKKREKLLEEAKHAKDPFNEYDEGKGWIERVSGLFEKKTYELKGLQKEKRYTIDDCVQLALKRSQRIIMSGEQVKLAEQRVFEARRAIFPTVTGKYEPFNTGKVASGTNMRHYQGKKWNVEVKQNLFDGMGTWFAIRQSQTNLAIVNLEQEKVQNETIKETKKAYYLLDKAIKAVDVQKKYKDKVNSLYTIIDGAYQQELVSRVEYLKVKGQNIQADFQYISSGEDVSLAEIMLFQAMNMEPEERIDIVVVPPPGEEIAVGLENCYSLAMANRPEIRIKEKTVEYYSYERKMMKAKGWPKVEFQGSFGQSMEVYQPTNNPDEQRGLHAEWYAGGKASVPLWGNTFEYNYVREHWTPSVSAFRGSESTSSYFSIKFLDDLAYFSNLQEARVGFESAKYEYQKARNDLLVEVKEMYFKYRKAILQLGVSRAKEEHQTMFVDVLEERRKYGEMEVSRVVEEFEKLSTDEYGRLEGESNYHIALVELSSAVGITEYFKAGHEGKKYAEWKKKKAEIKNTIELEKIEKENEQKKLKAEMKEEKELLKQAEKEARRLVERDNEERQKMKAINKRLVNANKALDKKDFTKARKSANEILKLDPASKEAKRLLEYIEEVTESAQ